MYLQALDDGPWQEETRVELAAVLMASAEALGDGGWSRRRLRRFIQRLPDSDPLAADLVAAILISGPEAWR